MTEYVRIIILADSKGIKFRINRVNGENDEILAAGEKKRDEGLGFGIYPSHKAEEFLKSVEDKIFKLTDEIREKREK